MPQRRLAIIGAGPIGLEAALAGVRAGFEVQVFERGEVASHVRDWGHVTMFSPFGMNSSPEGRATVGNDVPETSALLTGNELAEEYLIPLSRTSELAGRIHEKSIVVGVSRHRLTKSEQIGRPERAEDPFRLLVVSKAEERSVTADIVFDCTGVYGQPNAAGAGGLPAVGESWALGLPDYRLPNILGEERESFAGKSTLVIGSGFSAATNIVALAHLANEFPGTRVVWVTREGRHPPLPRIENDALPERDRLASTANELAVDPNSPIHWRPGRVVESIERVFKNPVVHFDVTLLVDNGGRERRETLRVDRVIANVGFRPDRSLYEELQVHECYATQGPIKLAAALLGETSSDCLAQTGHGVETLCNPEPGFFILGAKSYGRDSRFLINIGLQQIRDVIEFIK